MNTDIAAICFDVGGTLRAETVQDGGGVEHLRQMQALLGVNGTPQAFYERVRGREKQYRAWCKRSLVELNEADLWARYLLPDLPEGFVRENALALNRLWRASRHTRILPDAVETIKALAARGYRLAIVSNTTSSEEAPQLLAENGLTALFSTVILSCAYGRRKPHPAPFVDAARAMRVAPARCAYVGDNLDRDLVGARQAGYGAMVMIDRTGYQPEELELEDEDAAETITLIKPDHRIGRLSELLSIYPDRRGRMTGTPEHSAEEEPPLLYDAALSSMWWDKERDSAQQFCEKGRALGFARLELSHQISPAEFATFDLDRFTVGSLHDPFPVTVPLRQLDREGRQLASLEPALRREAVDNARRTIELASRLGARGVVIHPGCIAGDHSPDDRLRELYRAGQKGSPDYERLRLDVMADRARRAPAHLDALLESVAEMVAFAKGSGVTLGLENRYHYYELPAFDEMSALLDAFPQAWVGWHLDVGHIQTHEALGLMSFQQWLDAFAGRMVAVHLHDIIGISDHRPPGTGEIDFRWLAGYLPTGAARTVEVGKAWSQDDMQHGLDRLEKTGCIARV